MFVAQQNQDLCTPFVRGITLLGSKWVEVNLELIKKSCGSASMHNLNELLKAMPAALVFASLKRKGFGSAALRKSSKATPFTLALNATNALFSVIKVIEY